jgi:E3 ubiquitin-protein ligase DOA10
MTISLTSSLLQWIRTKKVTKCELCKYPFKLSKGLSVLSVSEKQLLISAVYDPDMPSRVPHHLFIQRLLLQLRNNILTYLRFLLVCFIWLGLVPFLARWIWRFYFRFGDWSARPTPSPTTTSNATESTEKSGVLEDGFFGLLRGQDIWTAVLRDCFQGQIITICLVAVFVVVFLIREWVMQNAAAAVEENLLQPGLARQFEDHEQAQEEVQEEPQLPVNLDDDIALQTELEDTSEDEPLQDNEHEQGFYAVIRQPQPDLAPPEPNPTEPIHAPPPEQVQVEVQLLPRPLPEDEDLDADDFDGIWDILGMQGPIIGLLHNTVFSALMIALAVGLGVWLPFMFGKTALGALAHPLEVLVRHPLNMCRILVDVGLDAILFVVGGTLLMVHDVVRHLAWTTSWVVPPLNQFVEKLDRDDYHGTYLKLTQSAAQRIVDGFLNGTQSTDSTAVPFLDHPLLSHFKTQITEYTDFTSLKGTITEKVIAVIAGYLIFTCLGAIYLRVRKLRDTQLDNTERLIRDILRQAGAVLKVVVIISIELVVFPIFCGTLIDLACLPLFPGVDIASRIEFMSKFTFTATFLHWFAGTLYMFHFAMFVSMCRDFVRPGTLYFIRDPNDPQFHPIREIIERPTLHQLRKIGVSGIIYAMLILLCFGLVVKAIDLCGSVLPLQISSLQPVFEVPVDLLMSHILLPVTAHFVKPSSVLKSAWKWWFNSTARILRLSSFLFGTRVPDEEGTIPFRVLLRFKRRPKVDEIPSELFQPNGSFLRVPATDAIPLQRRKHMLIPVTEDNNRLDGVEETDAQKNDVDFRVVYVPPHFSTRITLLFVWMWLYSVILGLAATLVPILLGRRIFHVVFGATTPTHDVYAYGLGIYSLIATVLLTEFVAEKLTILRRSDQGAVKNTLITAGRRLVKWLYLVLVAGVVLPLLVGACLDLYIMLPFKRLLLPDDKIEMQIMQDWALGIIHLKIVGRIILYLENRHAQVLRNVQSSHY